MKAHMIGTSVGGLVFAFVVLFGIAIGGDWVETLVTAFCTSVMIGVSVWSAASIGC